MCDNKVGPDPIILNNPDCCSQSLFDVSILMTDHVLLFLSNICVPILCHSAMRHQAHASPLVMSAGQTIRGSDSQLCPRPPPKPSKVPSLRQARGPCLLPPAGLSPSTPREHSPGLPSVAAACPPEATSTYSPRYRQIFFFHLWDRSIFKVSSGLLA